MICYDSLVSSQRATADVAVSVVRNVNSPVFSAGQYSTTIPEEYELNRAVLTVAATDADNVRSFIFIQKVKTFSH